MPKRTINYVLDIMEYLRRKGIEKEVSMPELVKLIRLICGNDSRVIRNYIQFMTDFDFIKPISANTFELNWRKVDEMVGI